MVISAREPMDARPGFFATRMLPKAARVVAVDPTMARALVVKRRQRSSMGPSPPRAQTT
tara:strand:+ start:2125 stop:2301 length:177 start_codon:yes stop_codon:yes gene_type:complete